MKALLLLQAQYNQHANNEMYKVLDTVDQALLYQDVGLHFKSIMHTLAHNLAADIGIFCKEFSSFSSYSIPLETLTGYLDEHFNIIESLINDYAKIRNVRQEVDAYMIEIIRNTNHVQDMYTLSFPGISFTQTQAHLILALLNHSIHHRGQISAALDQLKIPNDFSGMLGMKPQ